MKRIKVKRYKGEAQLQRGMSWMARRGWTVQSHTSRKALFSLMTGIFTRKQIHTVTYTK